MRRPLALSLVLPLLAATACAPPRPGDPQTLDSPQAIAAVAWCPVLDELGETMLAYLPATDATCADDTLVPQHRALIANAGSQELHVLDVDLRNPYYVDLERGVPGENGIEVPEGTNRVAALPHPAFAVATTADPPTLHFVAPARGTLVPFDGTEDGAFELRESATLLEVLPGEPSDAIATVVVDEPDAGRLRLLQVGYGCIADDGRVEMDCAQRAVVRDFGGLDVGGVVRDLAVAPDGRAWLTLRNRPELFEVALGEPARTDACGGATCLIATHAVGQPCRDGLDNDGDGLVDADDPQCFDGTGLEAGLEVEGALTTCTNGIDDDGDGVLDADDPGCRDAADRDEGDDYAPDRCTDGVDNDLDGLIDANDPDCATEGSGDGSGAASGGEGRALLSTALPYELEPPTCSNGIDDDGDGLVDWPADTDCYGPSSGREARTEKSEPTLVGVLPPGDVVAVVDAVSPQVLFLDAALGAPIEVNAFDPWIETVGAPLPNGIATAMLPDVVEFDSALEDGGTARVQQRLLHIASTSGIVHTYSVDTTFIRLDEDGAEVGRVVRDDYRLFDQDGRNARVASVDCSVPGEAADAYADTAAIECSDERLPQPVPVADAQFVPGVACADAPPYLEAYTQQPGDAFVALPQQPTYTTTEPELEEGCPQPDDDGNIVTEFAPAPPFDGAFYTLTRPLDAWLRSDRLRVVWEGVLPEASREDGRLADGWLRAEAGRPCEEGTDFCAALSALDLDGECPEAADLCDAGVDVCEAFDPCTACPSLCTGAADFCASGARPGDTVVFEPLTEAETDCGTLFVSSDVPANDPLLEYRVVDVAPGALRLAPIGSADDAWPLPQSADTGRPFVDRLPTDCADRLLDYEVRAGGSFAVRGTGTYEFSPYRALDGTCVLRDDAPVRQDRVVFPRSGDGFASAEVVTPMQLRFEVAPPAEPLVLLEPDGPARDLVIPRDFVIEYDVQARYDVRTISDRVLLLGPATSAAASSPSVRGDRLLFIDDGQSIVWIYSATSFRAVTAPIP